MRVAIDGVQRRSNYGVMPALQLVAPAPRMIPRRLTPGLALDGMVRRVAQPAPAAVLAAPAPLVTAQPLAGANRWLMPATLAVATVGLATATLGVEAHHLQAINLAAILPYGHVSATTTTPTTATSAPAAVNSAAATAVATAAAQQAMQTVISQQAVAAGVPTGIMAIDLKTGAVASSNADAVFTSASLYKLFVAAAIYQGIDAGTIHYTDTAGSTGMNVQSCLNAMITVSSNPCGEALAGMVGWDSQNTNLHAAGFTHTLLRQYDSEQTSASDVASLLQKLYNGTLVSPASSDAFIGLLKAQQINDRLPVGLPAGVSVAHKTGDLDGLAHDAGIVYAPSGNYIVVAMTGPWDSTGTAYSWFGGFSDSLYASLTAARAPKVIR